MDSPNTDRRNAESLHTQNQSTIDLATRRRFANVLLIGILFYVYAAVNLILLAGIFQEHDPTPATLLSAILTAVWCGLMIVAGYGVRRFKKWGMILAIVASVIAVLFHPFNIIPASIIVYYLIRSRECFSEAFQKNLLATLDEAQFRVTQEQSSKAPLKNNDQPAPAEDHM